VIVLAASFSLRVLLLSAGVVALAIGVFLARAMARAGMLDEAAAPVDL
jgi:hypothetical protein